MSPGQFARRALGRHFEPVGRVYRRAFVNLDIIADLFAEHVPPQARVIDIGGGDGAMIERLLDRRRDIHVTMCDISPTIGAFLAHPVDLMPATDFAQVRGRFDCVTISDVIHHVRPPERDGFFANLADRCARWGCHKIILKDIEPGGARAILSVFADRYITGDRHVELFSRTDLSELVKRHFPKAERMSFMPDPPNYCEVLKLPISC